MRSAFLLLLLSGLLALPGCDSRPAPPAAASGTQTVRDDLGRPLTLPRRPRRIMALAASMTEMLYAVADTSTIVGRSQVCNYPPAVLKKPVVNSYPLDWEGIVARRPDVVFSVEGIISPDDARRLQELGIPIYYQRYRRVEDVFRGLSDLGRLLGREAQAKHLTDSLRNELKQLTTSLSPHLTTPKVLAITWQDPIYAYGQNTLFSDEVRLAGGRNAITEVFAQPFPALTREYVLKLNPDVLIGGRLGKLDSTFFNNYPELRRIRAYQTRRVFPITGDLMERPSPRVVEAIRELHSLLQCSSAAN